MRGLYLLLALSVAHALRVSLLPTSDDIRIDEAAETPN